MLSHVHVYYTGVMFVCIGFLIIMRCVHHFGFLWFKTLCECFFKDLLTLCWFC